MLPGTYTFTGTIKTQIFRQPKWDQHSVKCNITGSTSRTLSKMTMLQFTNHLNIPKQECMSYQVTRSQPNKTKAVVFRWQKKESRLNRCVQNVTRLIISKFFTFIAYSWPQLEVKELRISTDLTQHFFSERIITWKNSLDKDTVLADNFNWFKRRLQKWKDKDEFTFGHDVW